MIRSIIAIITMGLIFTACNSGSVNQQQTSETITEEEGFYGAQISVDNLVSGDKVISMLEEQDSVWVSMKSKIVSNCQTSGCWMDLDVGNDEVIKVTFKDYAFFVPLDSEGKTAVVEGFAKREMIPVDILQHYAEDEGKSKEEIAAITEPEFAYTFEAIGVVIED